MKNENLTANIENERNIDINIDERIPITIAFYNNEELIEIPLENQMINSIEVNLEEQENLITFLNNYTDVFQDNLFSCEIEGGKKIDILSSFIIFDLSKILQNIPNEDGEIKEAEIDLDLFIKRKKDFVKAFFKFACPFICEHPLFIKAFQKQTVLTDLVVNIPIKK